MCINLSNFRQFPSLDGRGKGRVRGGVPCIHPHLTSPVKGEEGWARIIFSPMRINLRVFIDSPPLTGGARGG